MNILTPVPKEVPCRCCAGTAVLYGVVDFHQNSSIPLPCSGIPIYYHRCPLCRLIFTVVFDTFTTQDFLDHIYNEGYLALDSGYLEERPRNNCNILGALFGEYKDLRILDYGGGEGILERMLRETGFCNVDTYDPMVSKFSKRPEGLYDLILSTEVVEHTPTPRETFSDMGSFRKKDGVIFFSTLVQPANIDELHLTWWYVGPRNGHVTLYTVLALNYMAKLLGLSMRTWHPGIHLMYDNGHKPAFVTKLMDVGQENVVQQKEPEDGVQAA